MRKLQRAAVLFCAVLPAVTWGQVLTPAQDAYYVPGYATNFGAAVSVTVGSSGSVGLVQFDLGALPPGTTAAQVQRATVALFINKVNVPGSISVSLANGAALLFHAGTDPRGLRFELGWGHLALAAIAWVLLSRRESKDRDWLRFFTPAAIVLCILMFPVSVWVWDHFPLIRFVQFPFRLLAPITLCIAMLVAPLGPYLYPVTGKRALWFAGALALLIVPNLAHLRPTGYTTLDLTFWTPHQLAAWGYEPNTSYDFLPRVAAQLPAYDPRSARAVEGEAGIQELDRNPELWSGKVTTRGGALLEVSTIQFPGWRVEMDDREAPAYRSPNTGLIRFRVEPGEHLVEVGFHRTADRWTGDSLSVLAGLGLLLGFVRLWRSKLDHNDAVFLGPGVDPDL
ncbi:MAG: hypothetical protein P4L56_19995 [Candidatus Sulfopaludibacter sp.]|nr:hypothetical protein [Candidatus Sulfopaludibacter sp.]